MPMSLSATKQKTDALYAAQEAQLIERQSSYITSRGRYFQGLPTHSQRPSNGNETAPDFSRKPTDQDESWTPSDFPAIMPASMEVEIVGDIGYIVRLSFLYDEDIHFRQIGYEGMSRMTHDWLSTPKDAL